MGIPHRGTGTSPRSFPVPVHICKQLVRRGVARIPNSPALRTTDEKRHNLSLCASTLHPNSLTPRSAWTH